MGDSADLLAVFHRHIRFLGEILHILSTGNRSMQELNTLAAERYQLPWRTLDQVRRRISWLTCLNLVERKTNVLYGLTEAGLRAVPLVEIGPEIALDSSPSEPVTISEIPPRIQALLSSSSQESLRARNASLGYIPRGAADIDIIHALRLLVSAASPSIARAEFLSFVADKFGVSEGSFGAVMTTLTKSGLIEQTGFNIYSPTPEAGEWLESDNSLHLALLFHTKFACFLELLSLMDQYDRAPELARAAEQRGLLPRLDVAGVRVRLQLLRSAGLIVERANFRYQPSPLGAEILRRYETLESEQGYLGSQARPGLEPDTEDTHGTHGSYVASLVQEIRDAATASNNPSRLEEVVTQALVFLGFEARHVGGAGRTDVLATVEAEDQSLVRVIVDAKSAGSGMVSETAVSFDTLLEHKKKHNAQMILLVGPGFESGRIRNRALQNNVTLLTTDQLIRVVQSQGATPVSSSNFLLLLKPGPQSFSEFEKNMARIQRRRSLLGQVVDVLAREAREPDDVTKGALTSDQIYLIIRSEVDPRPSPSEIEQALRLLEHPFIDAVKTRVATGSRTSAFYLSDKPALVRAKILSLAAILSTQVQADEVQSGQGA